MAIISTLLTTTNSTSVYTSTGSTTCTVIYICNSTASGVTVDINVGTTASADNLIYKALPVNASDTYVIDRERIMFEDGQKLFITASVAGAISVTVSYIEV